MTYMTPPLTSHPESDLQEGGEYRWEGMPDNAATPQLLVFALRPGLEKLEQYLCSFFKYDKEKEEMWQTDKANLYVQVCTLKYNKVVFDSTEVLKKVHKECVQNSIFSVLFANIEVWGISRMRIRRIFPEKDMKLWAYNAPAYLSLREAWGGPQRSGGNKAPSLQMAQPERAAINPGCPPNLDNADLHELRKEPILRETILCRDKEIEKQTLSLLDSYGPLWATDAFSCGSFRDKESQKIIRFDIKFAELKPIVDRPRWLSPVKREAVKEVLGSLLKQDIIAPAYSRWRLNPVFVEKKPENISKGDWVKRGFSAESWAPGTPDPLKRPKLRLTVDIKRLNDLMTELPMAPFDTRQLIAELYDNSIISTLDCSLAFNSLHLGRAAASTCSHYGGLPDNCTYSHQRVMMGSKQSSCMLSAALLYTLQPCMEYVYLCADDIIVLAKDEKQMLTRLSNVFRNLMQAGFKLKRHKLNLFIGSRTPVIDLFGLSIDLQRRMVFPIKRQTQEILSRPVPTTVTQMKSLLGVLAWWHSFLPGHQKYNQILHQMTHKTATMEWNESRMQALEWVLDMLVSPFCHNYLPHPTLPFYLAVDASQHYAGLVLWQQEEGGRPRIVGYHAKIFTQREARATAWEREAFSVIYGIHTFWRFISGRQCVLYVDSKTSVFISEFSHSNSKVARFRIFLESLDWIKVRWEPGKSQKICFPDFLSRRSEQPKVFKNRQVSKTDEEQVEKVSSKLALHYEYSMKQSLFLLDYLLDLSENEIRELPQYTLKMNDKGQIECDLRQSSDHPHQIDLVEKEIQRGKNEI